MGKFEFKMCRCVVVILVLLGRLDLKVVGGVFNWMGRCWDFLVFKIVLRFFLR